MNKSSDTVYQYCLLRGTASPRPVLCDWPSIYSYSSFNFALHYIHSTARKTPPLQSPTYIPSKVYPYLQFPNYPRSSRHLVPVRNATKLMYLGYAFLIPFIMIFYRHQEQDHFMRPRYLHRVIVRHNVVARPHLSKPFLYLAPNSVEPPATGCSRDGTSPCPAKEYKYNLSLIE